MLLLETLVVMLGKEVCTGEETEVGVLSRDEVMLGYLLEAVEL